MGAELLRRALGAVDVDGDPVAARREADAFGMGADADALVLEDAAHGLGDVGVLAADDLRALLDDGDLGAEAAEGLGELEADVAAADDDEVAGQLVEGEQRAVVEGRDVADAGEVGERGAARRR